MPVILWIAVALAGAWPCPAHGGDMPAIPTFVDVTTAAGLDYQHGYIDPILNQQGFFDQHRHTAGGVAAGDYDNDGWIDLYVVRGDIGPNLLFRNRRDGTFEEVGAAAGLALEGRHSSGPTFTDVDGDGRLDLAVAGVNFPPLQLFRNRGDGTFEDVSNPFWLTWTKRTFGASFGDYDRDGDLDMALAHWLTFFRPGESSGTLWRNDGNFQFTDVSIEAGLTPAFRVLTTGTRVDHTYSPNFLDLDRDGWPELLLIADFRQTQILRNRQDGTFEVITDPKVITDQNGMGVALGDFDGDLVTDMFVTSIWDPDGVPEMKWGVTGNRFYRGLGDGSFEDATDAAGVREGYWGWAATASDLNNDGWLDIFHVNGFGVPEFPASDEFIADPSRLFLNRGDGTFVEASAPAGVNDSGNGRGLVSFDYDHDGDLDLFIANIDGPPTLFRNESGGHYLQVELRGFSPNTQGIGARVEIAANGRTQYRELRAGTNFESQDPPIAHFGMGESTEIEELRVIWPDGSESARGPMPGDQFVVIGEWETLCGSERARLLTGERNGGQRAALTMIATLERSELDPVASGARLLIGREGRGSILADLTIPPGAWSAAKRIGWRVNRSGTVFKYRGPANERITVRDLQRSSPGEGEATTRRVYVRALWPNWPLGLSGSERLRLILASESSLRSVPRCAPGEHNATPVVACVNRDRSVLCH